MRKPIFIVNIALIALFAFACVGQQQEQINVQSKHLLIPSVAEEPTVFEEYAVSAGGSFTVKGKLETEGPLADIECADGSVNKSKSILTGKVSKSFPVKTKSGGKESFPSFDNAYIFNADGTVEDINGGVSEQVSPAKSGLGNWSFAEGTWTFHSNGEIIDKEVGVNGNLRISGKSPEFRGAVYVHGNLTSSEYFDVCLKDPFSTALTVKGNADIASLLVTGKIDIKGNLRINGSLDIIGSVKAGGDIIVEGNAKISYFDTVYKAAIAAANEEFKDEGALLVHSQIFKNLDGKSSIALFTFSKGYTSIYEEDLLRDINEGETDGSGYFSRFVGASMDYGTTLGGTERLSNYYANKLYVLKKLEADGYEDAKVIEALYAGSERFYLTFGDVEGRKIGTYLIHDLGFQYSEGDALIVLTDSDRKKIKQEDEEAERELQEQLQAAVEEAEEQEEALTKGVTDSGVDAETYINSLTDAELAELGLRRSDLSKTEEELRTDEWRDYKSLVGSEKQVTTNLIVWEEDTAQSKGKRFWKRMRRRVKNIFRTVTRFIYHSEWRSGYIKGVDPNNPYDEWMTTVHMNNTIPPGSCGPISAAMILYWHDTIHYGVGELEKIMQDNPPGQTTVGEYVKWAIDPIEEGIQWILDIGKGCTLPWELDHKITHAIDNIEGLTGSAEWDWSTSNLAGIVPTVLYFPILPVNLLDNRRMFNDFRNDVKNNQPGIIGMLGFFDGYLQKPGGHFMPVIGYKLKAREVFNVDTVIFDECYVYADTNWPEGKRFWRIDVWSNINSALVRIKVNVKPTKVTPHYHKKTRRVWKWKKFRYVTKTEIYACYDYDCTLPRVE